MTATMEPAEMVQHLEPDPDSRTIHERMVAVLAALPAIGRTHKNEQQRFMFRAHDDVLNALNPLLAAHGVFVVPEVVERVTDQRTTGKGSTMYEVSLHVRFRFYGLLGDYVEASGWGEGTDMGDKSTNKAMTAAFKYVLATVFAIATAETADLDEGTPVETTGSRHPGGQQRRRSSAADAAVARSAAEAAPPAAAAKEDVDALVRSLMEEEIAASVIDEKFAAAREANRGELHPDYVAEQLANSQARLAAKQAAADTDPTAAV